MPTGRDDVAVTGIGMVTSVGRDAISASAALRAGIVRPAPTGCEVLVEDAMEMAAVVGHPVRGFSAGFRGPALAARLGGRALRDLASRRADAFEPTQWARTHVWLCSAPARGDELGVIDDLMVSEMPRKLFDSAGVPFPEGRCRTVLAGATSVIQAAQQAAEALVAGSCAAALVLGVDSLLDGDTIAAIAAEDRLKTPVAPTGLMPGEGAAVFLLERAADVGKRGGESLATLAGVACASVEPGGPDGLVRQADALASVVGAVCRGSSRVQEAWFDLNGEERRSCVWGHAQVRLRAHQWQSPDRVNLLASSLGETGAAGPAIAICAAVRSLSRGYAMGDDVLVGALDDAGLVAATRVSKVPTTKQGGST